MQLLTWQAAKREYTGTTCGRSLDRDVNAARNLAAPARTPRPGAPPRQGLRLSCTSGASEPGEAKLPSATDTLCGDGAAAFRPTGPGDATLPQPRPRPGGKQHRRTRAHRPWQRHELCGVSPHVASYQARSLTPNSDRPRVNAADPYLRRATAPAFGG